MVLARVTVEILGAVPIAEVEVETSVERPGRSVELLAGELRADGRPVLRARAWRVLGRRSGPRGARAAPLPDADEPPPRARRDLRLRERRRVALGAGGWTARGPATVWTRMRIPVVEGEEPSPRQRVMVVADTGNGASNVLDWARFMFINTELTVHFLREPVGEWVCWTRATRARRGRRGLASSVLSDRSGPVAAARRRCSSRHADRPSSAGTSVTARRLGRSLRAGRARAVDGFGDRAQHGLHLEQREARPEAAAHAAAERDPRVGAGGLLEEALRAERERVRVDVLARVHRAGCWAGRRRPPGGRSRRGGTAPSAAAGRRGRPGAGAASP